MLLIREQRHLVGKVEQACRNENASPYNFFAILDDGLPGDMPMAANTKMLFTAYYLYDCIKDKNGVGNRFVDPSEINNFKEVRSHIIENSVKSFLRKSAKDLGKIFNFMLIA